MPPPAITKPQTILITLMVSICGALTASILIIALWYRPNLNSDFMAFWAFPRFATQHPIGEIYNAAALQSFQKLLYPGFGSFYPYLYPPTFLLAGWWLKFFAFAPAQILWTIAGLALFVIASLHFFQRQNWLILFAMLVSPASLLNIMTGETAYFTSALLIIGFAALPTAPVLAGIAFGLLTLKPQLGFLIPILLLARNDWAAIASASLTAAGLIAVSCFAFPPHLWLLWAHTLPAYQGQYFTGTGLNLNIIVTPAANLITLGFRPNIAWVVQLLCTIAIAISVYFCTCRAPYPYAVAALLTGTFLAVPHAYAYDTITLTAAMALCLRPATPLWQVVLGCVVYLAPLALLTAASHWFLYAIPEAVLFVTIILLALARPYGAILADEPTSIPATQP